MGDAESVASVHGHEHLPENAARLRLLQAAVRDDELEQLAARDKLGDEVDVSRLLDDLEQVDDVRVLDVLEDLDLARHALDIALVGDAILLEHLDSDPLAGEEVHAKFDLAKRALTYRLGEQVVANGAAAA